MPRSANATRKRVLDAAYRQFYRHGFARVSMDDIAAAAKVTKRTLYYHFASKDELVAAVLQAQNALALETFSIWTRKLAGEPAENIDKVFDELARWAAEPRWTGSGFTRLSMELADLPGHPARAAARKHKALVEAHLTKVLSAAGLTNSARKARELSLLIEGAATLMLIHGDRAYADAAGVAAKKLLRSDQQRRLPK
jgi:AcrR family transcriptional regulator